MDFYGMLQKKGDILNGTKSITVFFSGSQGTKYFRGSRIAAPVTAYIIHPAKSIGTRTGQTAVDPQNQRLP